MDEIPDRWRPFEERKGLVPASHRTMYEASRAIKRSLPTRDHACPRKLVGGIERRPNL